MYAHTHHATTATTMAAAITEQQQQRCARVRRAPTLIGKVWLVIAQAGEPIALHNIRNALDTVLDEPIDDAYLTNLLSDAIKRGYVVTTGDRRSYRYKITPGCTVPTSITVRQVLEAGLA